MRLVGLLLSLGACWTGAPAPTPVARSTPAPIVAPPPGATACTSIDGLILDMDTEAPLADVEVRTGPEDDVETTRTDQDGRFAMRYRGHVDMWVTDATGAQAYLMIEAHTCHLDQRYVDLYPP